MSDRHDDFEAIRALLARYCQLCDDGRFDEWGLLFTDDCEFSVLGNTHRGREAAQSFITEAQPLERRGKHMISEPLIELAGDEAHCTTDYAFIGKVEPGLGVTSTGRYVDRIVRESNGWRFAARTIHLFGY